MPFNASSVVIVSSESPFKYNAFVYLGMFVFVYLLSLHCWDKIGKTLENGISANEIKYFGFPSTV